MRLNSAVKVAAAMTLSLSATFLTGSPAAAQEPPDSVKQTAAGGHLLLLPDGTERAFTSMQAAIQAGDAAGLSVAVFYDWVNYNSTGATMTVSVNGDCSASTNDKDFGWSHFPNGWDNRVSSVTTQLGNGSHCDVWFSSDVYWEGECGNQWIDKHWDLTQVPYGCNNKASSFDLS